MNVWRTCLLWLCGFGLALPATAAELQVIAGGGIAAPLNEIAARFEKATGHKLVIRYGTTPELVKMATGSAFDLGVVPVETMRDEGARAAFAPGGSTEVARVGIGLAVRAGAPKPDISTAAALKKTLLEAKSIASIPASATGYLLDDIYAKLGIAAEMKARTRAQPAPAQIVSTVASGENEIGIFLTNVLTAPGIDLVGPFPPEIQREVVYTSGVAARAKEAEAAKALLAFLRSAEGAGVIRSKGMVAP